jgi:hypothetical protein
MINVVSITFFSIQCIMIIMSFLSSIIFINKKSIRSLRFFVIYTSVSMIVMVPMILMIFSRFRLIHYDINFSFADSINNYSLIFNYLFLSVFIISSMPGYKSNRLLWILFFVFLAFVINSLFSNIPSIPSYNAFAINHFALIVFSMIFLIKLFFNLPETNVVEYPLFWVVVGVLSCSVINFPLFYLLDVLTKLNENSDNTWWLTNLRPLGYSIMYFMFSIAFKISNK